MKRYKARGRSLDGIFLLDKPINITSNAALQEVKQLYKASKAGHTGSLDPLASGMLPICFGKAAKFSQFLLEADKAYQVVAKLGVITESGDAEGKVISEQAVSNYSLREINAVLAKFRGNITQIPSMYSAIKHQGQPLYKLARQGIVVDRKPREVSISRLELLNYHHDLLEMAISCSKGTYIRTLVEDIGKELQCGAHVIALRRVTLGPYLEEQMVTLETLKDKFSSDEKSIDQLLLPISSMVSDWPEVKLSEAAIYYIHQGQSVISPYSPTSGKVKLLNKNGDFLGIGVILDDGKVAPKRLL